MTSSATTTTTIRKSYGNRKLYSFPEDYPLRSSLKTQRNASNNTSSGSSAGTGGSSLFSSSTNGPKKNEDNIKLSKYIDDNIVGKNNAFLGPFGRRKVVYCDYAASGRSLQFIEEYILREVLPSYGNTHSTTSITSLQSTVFRQEARDIVKNAVNASDLDAVLFIGHGCTDALQKLISALDLRELPIVFTGSWEHYDNLHLWQKIGAKIIRIAETKDGFLDLTDLENKLLFYQNYGRQMIGCFSIASNVTGIIIDDLACTILLHQYNALAFWDYNIAAPSITIDMNPSLMSIGVDQQQEQSDNNNPSTNKDAIYFSGHKFIGGCQTPGILIVKKAIFRNRRLSSSWSCCIESDDVSGFFTQQDDNKSFEMQEEGSCTAIIESIRAGLVMQLKESVTVANILQRQEKINKQMLQHIRTIPEIILLGNTSPNIKRLPIFSFMVRHPRGSFLHHNFIAAVLNDIFGIQARAGCPCSGAYAQDLLGIDPCLADQYENIILEDRRLSSLNLGIVDNSKKLQLLRPGFTRISLPYFMNDAELAFIMEAVKMVATEGWKLLPQYVVELETGEWRHHSNATLKDRKWLSAIRYIDGKMTMNERRRISGPGLFPQNYSECLQTARNLFNKARKTANRIPYVDQDGVQFDGRGEKLRWFMLQNEAQNILTSNAQNIKQTVPFDPVCTSSNTSNNGSNNNLFTSESGRLKKKKTTTTTNNTTTTNTTSDATTTSATTRHYSLDDTRLLRCSSPIIMPSYFLQDVNGGLYYPQLNGSIVAARERCFSLGAPNISPSPPPPPPPLLPPSQQQQQHQILSPHLIRQRQLSYTSSQQSELYSLDYSSGDSLVGNATPPPPSQSLSSDDSLINNYVTEMTKELATNIKSEIREVISKVEDVLLLDNLKNGCRRPFCERHGDGGGSSSACGSEDGYGGGGRCDSISADEVAEYIEKVSIEMANEVKSEIRDVVSAVDVFIAPSAENQQRKQINSMNSSESSSDNTKNFIVGNNDDDITMSTKENSVANKINIDNVSSQDSGISLSFSNHEQDTNCIEGEIDTNNYCDSNNTELSDFGNKNKKNGFCFSPTSQSKIVWQSTVEAIQEFDMIRDGDRILVCLLSSWPWWPTDDGDNSDHLSRSPCLALLHTLLQYQSYAKQKKNILFSLGAVVTIESSDHHHQTGGGDDDDGGGGRSGDCNVLISYLKGLGVHCIVIDEKNATAIEAAATADHLVGSNESDNEKNMTKERNSYSCSTSNLRCRLYTLAKTSGYNVLAIGQHFDDLCEHFLLSTFYTGRLRTMRAHYFIKKHDLRIIRPFVYVRGKSLHSPDLSDHQDLPSTSNLLLLLSSSADDLMTSKERVVIKEFLMQQELINSKLFTSLRLALHPLLLGSKQFCDYDENNKKYRNRRLKLLMKDNNNHCCWDNVDSDEEEKENEEEKPVTTGTMELGNV